MPVIKFHCQLEPPDEAPLWRFMDFRKFHDLMANQELYFRRADLFTDPTEGLPPNVYAREVMGYDKYDPEHHRELSHLYGSIAQMRESYFINCWHMFDGEELGMWDCYGHDGVAVCTTYGRLKDTLGDVTMDEVLIGQIRYGTEHLRRSMNTLEFITTKQKQYEPERELRVMLSCPAAFEGANRHFGLDNWPHPYPIDINPRHEWIPEYKRRRIDLKKLITDVVISPWAEPDAIENIPEWTKSRGFNVPLQSSLRSELMPSLEAFRKWKHLTGRSIVEAVSEPQPSDPKTVQALQDLLTNCNVPFAHLRYLYRQRWEACRLPPTGLPLLSNIKFLEANWKALEAVKEKD